MSEDHADRLRAAFTTQAETMEDPTLGIAFTSGLDWLADLAGPRPDDVAIDLAGGTGLVARHLAPRVGSVLVVDVTPAILATGRRAAAAEGLTNVDFLLADATDLPLPDTSFSLAVTRFSLHHVPQPTRLLDELVRVTRPGGRVVVKDLVANHEPEVAARQDELEILRDDSHLRMVRPGEVAALLTARGCRVATVARRDLERPLQAWLDQSRTPADRAAQVHALLRAELDGGPATGLRPYLRNGELWFRHGWEATVATRPSGIG